MSSQVTPITRRLGANIRSARESAGLTQRQLGDRLGVDGSDISRHERGVVRPGDERLARLASVLGREIGWFYADNDPSGWPDPDPSEREVA